MRTLLTMLAIAIGAGAIVIAAALGAVLQSYVMHQLDVFGPDILALETKAPSSSGHGSFGSLGITITTLKDKDLETVLKYPNISSAYGMVTGQEAVSYQGQIKKVLLMGHGYQAPDVEKVTLDNGRFYTKEEEYSLANVVVLGMTVKEKFFSDSDPIGQTIYIHGKPFTVVGVLAKRGSAFFIDMDNLIYIPARTMQKRLLGINYFVEIVAKMRDNSQSAQTKEDLLWMIRENHNITDPSRDDFVINTQAEAAQILSTVTGGITLLLLAIVAISLIVGGVGIMNIMYVSVVERTFEIGLRKAVGATKANVLWQFIAEALLLTLGGGVIGIVAGIVIGYAASLAAGSFGYLLVYSVPAWSIGLALSFSTLVGLVFGLYPARKASTVNPVDALRQEK